MKVFFGFSLLSFLVASTMFGCGNSSTGPTAPTTADLIGKWVISSRHAAETGLIHFGNGIPDSTYHSDSVKTFSNGNDYIILNTDQTYTASSDEKLFNANSDAGTWSLAGNQLRLISHTANDTIDLSTSVSGTNGTFVQTISQVVDLSTLFPGVTVTLTGSITYSGTKQ